MSELTRAQQEEFELAEKEHGLTSVVIGNPIDAAKDWFALGWAAALKKTLPVTKQDWCNTCGEMYMKCTCHKSIQDCTCE